MVAGGGSVALVVCGVGGGSVALVMACGGSVWCRW